MSNPAQHHKSPTSNSLRPTSSARNSLREGLWLELQDWGPEYISFAGAGISEASPRARRMRNGQVRAADRALLADLKETEQHRAAGGILCLPSSFQAGGDSTLR